MSEGRETITFSRVASYPAAATLRRLSKQTHTEEIAASVTLLVKNIKAKKVDHVKGLDALGAED